MRIVSETRTTPPRLGWSKKRALKREASRLQREIEQARVLLHDTVGETLDFQNPSVRFISSQIDALVLRYERIERELTKVNHESGSEL